MKFKLFILSICIFIYGQSKSQLNTERILAIGQNALYFEDYVLSIQYFNQVIKTKPYLSEAYLYRAIAKIQLGDYLGADQDCSDAIKLNPFMPHVYYARGFARRKLDFLPEAIADFNKALEFSPNNLFYLMNRIDAREQNKDYTEALSDLNLCKKLYPKKSNLVYEEGRLYIALKDTINAQKCFDEYLKNDSTSPIGWSARAFLKMQCKNYDGAYNDYTQAINRKSTYVGDYINRGILCMEKKNYKQAISDYNDAVKVDNKNPLAYFNRGILRASLGDNNNALTDFIQTLKLDSTNTEARLRKGLLDHTLGDSKSALKEFTIILEKHPNYLPVYYCLADVYDALGNKKEAFRYRFTASKLDANKDEIRKNNKQLLSSGTQIASNNQKPKSNNTALFNRFAAQNIEETEIESKYENESRGAVQDKYTDIVTEKNFVLSFYAKTDEIRRTNLFYQRIEQYNNQRKITNKLKITNNEIPLTSELISSHFETINSLSEKLNADPNADLYFYRAMEFSLVQDFKSSIDDLNKALEIRPDFMLAYFLRANIRYKLVEYSKNSIEQLTSLKTDKTSIKTRNALDNEIIMHDYDKTIELAPDFSFGYFNRGNMNCSQKEFTRAINDYSQAIKIDPEFAEAFFNRGLTYLFIGEDNLGLKDLSKAGELGIYKSYNLIHRFKK